MSLNNPSELHHLTLNSSGGIALGAFMAGVSFEIVKEALEEKYFAIDIITGASAGAMTGAIATYYLLQNNKHAFERPEGNALYQAWVEKADMQNIDSIKVMPIEEFAVFEKKPLSVLASKAIEEITKLIDRPPETIQRPIALLMTVTNLQGLLLKSDSNKKLISSAETREFFFYPGLERQDRENFTSMWNKVKAGGLASGAFPVAFSPIKDISNIESRNLDDLSEKDYFQNGDKKRRTYSNPIRTSFRNQKTSFFKKRFTNRST